MNGHKITAVVENSIGEALEIEAGDILLSINGQKIEDIFDYHYFAEDTDLTVWIQKPNGEQWELLIEKGEGEELGLVFPEGLMDQYRSCRNQCMFCFIDQMPPGMRETLYFKDDDARLSFLQGNYITLTNMKQEDLDRIIKYKLSPINISIHTMNGDLRGKMLNNRFAGEALNGIQLLREHGITMNSQIVLCKGINDGAELDRSIEELSRYYPEMNTLSVVPVGLTKYREGLAPLEKFEKEDAKAVLKQIINWQKKLKDKLGSRFVFASDEWYLVAEQEIPPEEDYEGYRQIENGVGMVRSLREEVTEALQTVTGDDKVRTGTLATGTLAAPIMEEILAQMKLKFAGLSVSVVPIINDFFGSDITVAGLLTGQDIRRQLEGKKLGDILYLPEVMLRNGEDVFLDDLTVTELENALQTEVCIVQSDGTSLIHALLNIR